MVAAHHCNGTNFSLELGPLNIDYIHLIDCEYKDFQVFTVPLLFVWITVLIDLLAKVASDYFSVNLANISLRWKLNDNFAGVTLVALANGAPDIFCAIIGMTSAGNASLSISALLGGSLFVSSVVLGSIAILCPCKVDGLYFTRDAIFLFITVCTVAYLGSRKSVDILSAISLCLLYSIYLLAVVITPYIERRHSNQQCDQSRNDSSGGERSQSAQWIQCSSDGGVGGYCPPTDARISSSSPENPDERSQGYKFLILDEYIESRTTSASIDVMEGLEQNPKSEEVKCKRNSIDVDISRKVPSQSFSSAIIWDFHPAEYFDENVQAARNDNITCGKLKFSQKDVDSRSVELDHLKESLLAGTTDDTTSADNKDIGLSFIQTARTKISNLRLIKRLVMKWSELSTVQKIQFIIEYPFVTAMELSITAIGDDLWNKKNAVIQPLFIPIFVLLVFGRSYYFFTIQFVIGYSFCIAVAAALLFLSNYSHPPRHPVFIHCSLFFGFFICVSWIYLLSGELVFCLTSVGTILNIPSFYLGLTILAWGNSVGDFFANLSIAKRGLGPMAVAGCYGGPIFNILIGLGVSFSYICYRNYPHQNSFHFDHSAYISVAYTLVALILSIAYAVYHQFRINAILGYMLISIYILYTVTETAVAILM